MKQRDQRPFWKSTQFNLCLILTCLLLVPLIWITDRYQLIQRQEALIAEIQMAGGTVKFASDHPPLPYWFQRWFRSTPMEEVTAVIFDFEDHPQIEKAPFQKFVLFPRLKEVELGVCGADTEIIMGLSQCRSIERLGLSYAKLGRTGYEWLSKLERLKNLNLAGADFQDADMQMIGKLTNLKHLALTGNRGTLTDEGVQHLSGLVNLEYVSFYETDLTDEAIETILNFTKLESLTLNRTQITGSNIGKLKQLKNLRFLSLERCQLQDETLEQVGELHSLTYLDISQMPITGAGLHHLESLKKLETLNLSLTKVTPEEAAELQKKLGKNTFIRLKN